ncbi:hypothetical protein [Leifsonia sp. 71-9]|uniref:hypothetical protein n=1 Tax=Leifsonia sp. 71-9 TaxID=1895934 RepID=UPI0009298072|nr:hypothetical protein [Leifsonia sp. 71-9]OJX72838.1 MAG: hypothetical protein BGO91_13800 [Leifsonia sp. 71-9]
MSIIDGKGLVTWEGGLFEPGSDLLGRTQWAFAQIRSAGGTIVLNEAGRPYGVPSDQYVRNASQTASGISTVYFQWGRYLRGETPSAANPALGPLASEHTQGIATDTNAPSVFDMTLRAKYFGQAGLKNTIASESWHWAIRGPVQAGVSLAAVSGATSINNTPQGDEVDMASLAEVRQQQDASNAAQTELIKQMLLREERGRLYYCSQPAAGLPNFIIIFWQRDPGQKAILYLNDGETQARNAREYYFQTYDTVEQAKAAEIAPGTFSKLVDFAEGRDSSYTNARAPK